MAMRPGLSSSTSDPWPFPLASSESTAQVQLYSSGAVWWPHPPPLTLWLRAGCELSPPPQGRQAQAQGSAAATPTERKTSPLHTSHALLPSSIPPLLTESQPAHRSRAQTKSKGASQGWRPRDLPSPSSPPPRSKPLPGLQLQELAMAALAPLLAVAFLAAAAHAADPFAFFDWDVTYMTASPLGVPQKVIAINKQFPGPVMNVTTNYNVVVNVLNSLDEPLLITWDGIQHRKNCWQDGVLGTTCPIPPGWNWTYNFQVKDQIGSFFYFPSIGMQRAAGGFGGITVNNRAVISVPFDTPDGDITLFIGDWYKKNHTHLRKMLDDGKELGMPDGVLMNGKGPYRYNDSLVSDGIEYETIKVEPGKTYRFRVHNVGVSTSLNFRIQNHNLALVETEGSYTMKQNFTNLDIHVGQSYSFLVTMDQNASSDYYIVASARFVNESLWTRVTGVAILQYSNSKGKASGPLPDPPNDEYDKTFSMNQARSIRMNVSTGAARPNPQGSFHYGSINVSQVYKLRNEPPVIINGKKRTTLSGISYSPPDTPLRLSDLYDKKGVYTLDFPTMPIDGPPVIRTSVINSTYKDFLEIVFQNNDTIVQTYHIDGYAFWVVGMDYGEWTENSRGTYNKWDGVSRCTTQVFPGAWTAVMLSLDSPGFWNVRTENLDTWYLGQETYIRVVDPNGGYNVTEMVAPDNMLYCGLLKDKQKAQKPHGSSSSATAAKLNNYLLVVLVSLLALALGH